MPEPTPKRVRSAAIFIRATPEQKTKWQQAAKMARRNLNDWIRIILDDEAEKPVKETR